MKLKLPKFRYEIGQNVYLVWFDTGAIERCKVDRISVIYGYSGEPYVKYFGQDLRIPESDDTHLSGNCVVFTDRRDAKTLAKEYQDLARARAITRLQSVITSAEQHIKRFQQEAI